VIVILRGPDYYKDIFDTPFNYLEKTNEFFGNPWVFLKTILTIFNYLLEIPLSLLPEKLK